MTEDAGSASAPVALVAEDQPLASMALRAQLEALGYHVLGPARDGDEAVALGACFPVDVALLDFRMPRCSGVEAAERLFELAPTPAILLTGVGNADLPDPIPEPPIFRLLFKPAGMDEIRSGIRDATARFDDWARNRSPDLDGLRRDRTTIARAVRHMAGDDERPASAALRLLARAREEQRTLIDCARDILAAV